ncbi:PE-PPE domain-containing protein [Hyalangium sp.]|uniref:PE-PPE domain-containing protein n=1 Tax=Hyalangium sp. TaxID=2028555 RepID=UPI002D440F7F|nr:PE-PPE domain-containing protein [Hyalangium sp.]HYI02249.1 PE-PPE domain-containing protein [Hyalangium sp.]
MNVGKTSETKSSDRSRSSESKPDSKPAAEATPKKAAESASAISKTAAGQSWAGKSAFDAKSTEAGQALKLSLSAGSPGEGVTRQALSNPVGNILADVSSAVGDTLADASSAVGDTLTNAATTIGNALNPPVVEQMPPIPSFTDTVTVTGNTLTHEEKIAAGAVQIDKNMPPSTYDGMYIGADNYAYPPDKFKVTDVPPFEPSNPLSDPPPTTYYVNGINTDTAGVVAGAQELANHTGTNVVPIYNATEGIPGDVAQVAQDRIGVGENKAADTLTDLIMADLENGKQVNVVGYSQGAAIVSRVLQEVDKRLADAQGGGWLGNLPFIGDEDRRAREEILGNINVVGIGGAGKNFPAGPEYTFYVNKQDPFANWLGVHPFNPVTDGITAAATVLIPGVGLLNGGGPGYSAPGATVHVIDEVGDPNEDFSPHLLDTYFDHILPN